MRKPIFVLLLAFVMLAACAGQQPAEEPEEAPSKSVLEEAPVETDIAEAEVNSVTIQQDGDEYIALVTGNLPDNCAQIHESSQTMEGNTIQITLTTIRPSDLICTAVLAPYTHDIVIDTRGLADGQYSVEVNGVAADQTITIGEAETAQVTGTIVYRERIALPDDAIVSVQLQDTSLADAPAVVLGEQTTVTAGQQVPLPFAVSYNPADIQDNLQYALSVRITDADGNLLFINDTVIPVITRGNPTSDIEVVVVSTGGGAEAAEEATDEGIFNKTWQWVSFSDPAVGPQEIEQPQRYQLILNEDGSANIKADCNSVQGNYTMDGSNITIELGPTTLVACPPDSLADQYLQNLTAARIWFTEEGDLFFDLQFDSGTMRFGEPSADEFENMLIGPVWEWTDYRLANETTAVPNPEAYLIQFMPDGTANITADCNNILAEYTLDGDTLTLQLGPTTLAFCGEESLDQQFVAGLSDAGTVSFDDQGFLRLALKSEDGEFFFRGGGEQVTGVVTYLQRGALPDDSVLQVTLQDISLADAPATQIGLQTYTTKGAQVPLPFSVSYNPAVIVDNHTYSVSARITEAEGNLLFISDTVIQVITNGVTSDVEIVVVPTD